MDTFPSLGRGFWSTWLASQKGSLDADLAGCGVGGYDLGMATDLESRRFTVIELFVYVSALSVTLGLLRVSMLSVGALIGMPVGVVMFGRRYVITGALLGAVAIWPILFVLAYIYLYANGAFPGSRGM